MSDQARNEDAATGARIVWSHNGEDFSHDSLEEAIESYGDISDLEFGRTFEFAEVVESNTNWVDADDIIEMIGDRAYDVGGEHADGFPEVPEQAKRDLADFLEGWQATHCVPNFWQVRNAKAYALTAADLAPYQAVTA